MTIIFQECQTFLRKVGKTNLLFSINFWPKQCQKQQPFKKEKGKEKEAALKQSTPQSGMSLSLYRTSIPLLPPTSPMTGAASFLIPQFLFQLLISRRGSNTHHFCPFLIRGVGGAPIREPDREDDCFNPSFWWSWWWWFPEGFHFWLVHLSSACVPAVSSLCVWK